MLDEFLWQNSWTYRDMVEQGLTRGLAKGLEQGRVQEVHLNIEAMTQARFPDLLAFMKSQVESLSDLARLQKILLAVGTAHTAQEVKQSLLTL